MLVKAEPRAARRAHPAARASAALVQRGNRKGLCLACRAGRSQGRGHRNQAAIAADDPKAIVLPLPELAPGKYTVKFRVLSVDGHVVDTSYDFTVKSKAPEK